MLQGLPRPCIEAIVRRAGDPEQNLISHISTLPPQHLDTDIGIQYRRVLCTPSWLFVLHIKSWREIIGHKAATTATNAQRLVVQPEVFLYANSPILVQLGSSVTIQVTVRSFADECTAHEVSFIDFFWPGCEQEL